MKTPTQLQGAYCNLTETPHASYCSLGRLGAELKKEMSGAGMGGLGLGSPSSSAHARAAGSPGPSHADSPRGGEGRGGGGGRAYDPQWQGYVEANLPFYSVLLHHFLTMCYRCAP